ncbi:hypothetical protein AWC29_23305 [Mycobacterium triplex]|nr:hypothetical protein [Mycobacterium triplex]ORX01571.1 hypothetical protein AWC29_23305 [Mycobacterium triplex]
MSVAALAVVGGAAVGIASVATPVTAVQLAAVGAPYGPALPQDPPPPPPPPPVPGQNLPAADQLVNLCNQVTDAGVSYTTKNNLVQGGISPDEGHVADHDLRKAYRNGNFPETFTVTNIAAAGPNAATADVAIAGPKFAGPVTKNLAFVNEGGNWIMQHDSAIALVQAASATN